MAPLNNAPLAYDVLWDKLRARFHMEAKNQAIRAATAKEEWVVRKAQGAFQMCQDAIAIMAELHELERTGGVPIPDEDDTRH